MSAQLWLDIRQAALAIVAAIEREEDISPLTSELRKELKALRGELRKLRAEEERQP